MKPQTIIASLLLLVAGAGLAFAASIVFAPAPARPVAPSASHTAGTAAEIIAADPTAPAPAEVVSPDTVARLLDRLAAVEAELARLRERRNAPRPAGDDETATGSTADATPAPGSLEERLAALEASAEKMTSRLQKVEQHRPLNILEEEELVALLENEDPVLRRRALHELRRRGSEAGIDAAIGFADSDDELLREAVADYFEDVPSPRGHEALMKLVYDDNNEVADAAVDAIAERGDAQAMSALEEVYTSATDPRIAYAAGRQRQRLSRDQDDAPPFTPQVNRWRTMLTDGDSRNRETAIWALGRFSNKADANLVQQMREDPDGRVRRAARRVLDEWGIEE